MAIELVLEETNKGCIIPTSHKLNQDGYFRKRVMHNGKSRLMMYHRFVWETTNGEIPKGYEVDHLCKVRSCCNIKHLQLLLTSEHRTKDNTGRHSDKKRKAYLYWLEDKSITGALLGEMVGVSFSAGCKWIREWKQ